MDSPSSRIVIGEVAGVFGVRGWLKIKSHTQPVENILEYRPWRLALRGELIEVEVLEGRIQGRGLVVHLDGLHEREEAKGFVGATIEVQRDELPETPADEYYWADLIGLSVVTVSGEVFGKVTELIETGSNDVLVVAGQRQCLVPFILDDVIKDVDLPGGRITVDWDPDF